MTHFISPPCRPSFSLPKVTVSCSQGQAAILHSLLERLEQRESKRTCQNLKRSFFPFLKCVCRRLANAAAAAAALLPPRSGPLRRLSVRPPLAAASVQRRCRHRGHKNGAFEPAPLLPDRSHCLFSLVPPLPPPPLLPLLGPHQQPLLPLPPRRPAISPRAPRPTTLPASASRCSRDGSAPGRPPPSRAGSRRPRRRRASTPAGKRRGRRRGCG